MYFVFILRSNVCLSAAICVFLKILEQICSMVIFTYQSKQTHQPEEKNKNNVINRQLFMLNNSKGTLKETKEKPIV